MDLLPLLAEGVHLIDRHTEDEDVLGAHLLSHLHVSTVQRADGQTAVQLNTGTICI